MMLIFLALCEDKKERTDCSLYALYKTDKKKTEIIKKKDINPTDRLL
jgi:hypothetical protein